MNDSHRSFILYYFLTKDTALFCFAKQWPMTRASSIKEFHQFALLTVTIPLEVEICRYFLNGGEMSPLRSAPVDIREIVQIRVLGGLSIVARAIKYKRLFLLPLYEEPIYPCFDLAEKRLTVTGIKTTRYVL